MARAKTVLRASANESPYQTIGRLGAIVTEMDQALDAELRSQSSGIDALDVLRAVATDFRELGGKLSGKTLTKMDQLLRAPT